MRQKVAIIIERMDVGLGGAERSVGELAGALEAAGCDAHILAAKGPVNAENVHILCPDTPGKRADYRIFEEAIRKHIEENHYDIIHSVLPFDFVDVYQPRGGTYAEAMIRNIASYCSNFVRIWKKATSSLNLRRAALLRAERNLCQKQNGPAIVAISRYVAEQFKTHYGVEDRRIIVIANGVEITHIDEKEAAALRVQILNRLGVKDGENPVLFLFAANNFRLKGLGCLLKALNLVVSRGTERPAYLVVAGTDQKCIIVKTKIKKKVLFLGGVADIGDLIGATDVAVLPTFYDPSSRFILEALAAGNPVITTEYNGAAELFTDKRHGRIIDRPDDINSLADALAYFANSENIRKATQAIQEDNLRQTVSISRVAGRLKEVYVSILSGRKR
jgi:UDP-glucose:(heptosyl)LPS alpha-1,3-glucosyltransferase